VFDGEEGGGDDDDDAAGGGGDGGGEFDDNASTASSSAGSAASSTNTGVIGRNLIKTGKASVFAKTFVANKLAEYVKENIEHGLVFREGAVIIKNATVLAYGDSSFANMPGEKSQAGAVLCLTNKPQEVVDGNFDKQMPLA